MSIFLHRTHSQVAPIKTQLKKIWQRFTRPALRNGEASQRIDLFNRMNAADRNRIAAFLHRRSFVSREDVYIEGKAASSCYWLITGSIELFCQGAEKIEERVRIVRAGEGFAFHGLLGGALHSHSARAIEPCDCLCLSSVDFTSLAQEEPQTAVQLLLTILAAQEKITEQHREDYIQLTRRLTQADIIV